MAEAASYDVGDEVIFIEITFLESGNREHAGTVVEVLRPREYYNIRVAGGGVWTVAADQIRRADDGQ